MSHIKVIAFDVFNTLVRLDQTPFAEIRDYGAQLRRPEWAPLVLPESWEHLPPYDDSAVGVARLKQQYRVVTLSNGPVKLQRKLLSNAGIEVDGIVPLEDFEVYKPRVAAYACACHYLNRHAREVLMVTANPDFGDIDGSARIGMPSLLIRQPGCPQSLHELLDAIMEMDK